MKTRFHIEITRRALGDYFSRQGLQTVIKANIYQDRIKYQIGHDHFHFEGSAFTEAFAYIALQEKTIVEAVLKDEPIIAQKALGRLTHTWQDFYSHSNYVHLWREKMGQALPEDIQPDDEEILNHPNLMSGKNYGLIEYIALIPLISQLITPFMPADSHAQMNLDGPDSGPSFDFAFWAAFKRSKSIMVQLKFQFMKKDISQQKIYAFFDK